MKFGRRGSPYLTVSCGGGGRRREGGQLGRGSEEGCCGWADGEVVGLRVRGVCLLEVHVGFGGEDGGGGG